MTFQGYWPIEEFARSILGGSSKHKAVAVLVGYFDESGISQNQPIALAGGAVADSVVWSRIELPWRRALSDEKSIGKRISCFHAFDCEQGEGEFSSVRRPLRDALAWRLSDEIGKIRPQCFAAGVMRNDWSYASPELRAAAHEDPYYLSVALCIEQIARWSRQYASGEPVALVFAKQTTLNAVTSAIHSDYFEEFPEVGAMSVATPQLVIPLQVADFVSYESYRYAVNADAGETRRLWKNLEKHGVGLDFRIHNRDTLPLIKPRGT
jgi:hypothetical protein